jgi:hypothetical protein
VSELFLLPSAARADPAIDAWLNAQSQPLSAIARTWFAQMRRCGDDVHELMHDGCPVACVGAVAFAYVNVFTAHVNVGFFNGASLDDPAGLLQGTGKRMRHVKLRADEPMDTLALRNLIEDAYANIRQRIHNNT